MTFHVRDHRSIMTQNARVSPWHSFLLFSIELFLGLPLLKRRRLEVGQQLSDPFLVGDSRPREKPFPRRPRLQVDSFDDSFNGRSPQLKVINFPERLNAYFADGFQQRLQALKEGKDTCDPQSFLWGEVADRVDELMRPYSSMFVGRDNELTLLNRFLEETVSGILVVTAVEHLANASASSRGRTARARLYQGG